MLYVCQYLPYGDNVQPRTIDQKAVGLRQISTIATSCLGHYQQNPKPFFVRVLTPRKKPKNCRTAPQTCVSNAWEGLVFASEQHRILGRVDAFLSSDEMEAHFDNPSDKDAVLDCLGDTARKVSGSGHRVLRGHSMVMALEQRYGFLRCH
jgi:hypothetical protein